MKTLPLVLAGSLAVTTLLAQGVVPGAPAPPQAQAAPAATTTAAPAPITPPAPAITFDGLTPIVVDRRDKDGNPLVTVVLKNDALVTQTPELSVVVIDRDDKLVPVQALSGLKEIVRGKPVPFTFSVKNDTNAWEDALPLRGYLVLQTAKNPAAPITREMRFTPAQPSGLARTIVLLSLLFAVGATVAGLWQAKGRLSDPIGSASWSDSWGSNVTLGSSLLTAFIGLVVFPEYTRYLPKSTYSVFSVAFPALVGLSPVVFGLIRSPSGESGGRLTYHGNVFGFALAAGFTLWGALGQLSTLVAALFELRATPAFPSLFASVLLGVVIVLTVGMVIYGAKSVKEIVVAASAPLGGGKPDASLGGARVVRNGAPGSPKPALEWPLL